MKASLTVEGLTELDALLGELPKSTARNVLKRGVTDAAQPMVQRMRELAPRQIGRLQAGIAATVLSGGASAGKAAYAAVLQGGGSKGEAVSALRSAQRDAAGQPLSVVVSIGPTGKWGRRIAHLVEFGTVHSRAHPFIRPGFDATRDEVIGRIRASVRTEIDKAVARRAKRAAKAG